jgi:PAS domain S-box-containing protein
MLPDAAARNILGLADGGAFARDRFIVLDSAGRPADIPHGSPDSAPEALIWQVWIDRLSGVPVHLQVAAADGDLIVCTPTTRQPIEVLANVANILLDADDPRAGAEPILGKLAFLVGAESLALLDIGPGRVHVEACHACSAQLRPLPTIDEHSIVRRAARERTELTVTIGTASEPWLLPWAALGLRTVHIQPLVCGGEPQRVLVIARRAEAAFDEETHSALNATCALWANAIHRQRISHAENRARVGMRALADTSLEGRGEPPLRELLRLLVAQACKLTRARYGALGVLNGGRSELADFVTVGIDEEDARRIGHVPRGVGMLGEVIREGRTIRVADLAADPRARGFPPNHPAMTTFLGAPLRIGKEIFGNFYLTEKEDGAEFSEEDAALLEAFAAQAALTVAYARETGRQRQLLDAVLHQAPHGILFVTEAEAIAFSNAAARRMLGLPTQEPTEPGYRLLKPDGQPLPPEEYPSRRALTGETIENVEVHIVRGAGDALPVFASAAPVRSETGRLLGAVVALQDLTPFKALERMREEFSAVVAHDLRSPLSAIMMQIEVLLRAADSGVIQAPVPALERMRRSGHTLEHLISDLLDAARIEGGRIQLDLHPLAVEELATRLVQQLAPTLGDRAVSVHIQDHPRPVLADPLRVEQVLTNLIENAAKYSADKAAVDVFVAPQDDGVTVSVHDRGPGIPSADLPRLFERYYRASRAPEKRGSLGLGLFIAKGLIDAHGGRLWAESTLGEGSVFSFWLPCASR